MGGIDDIRDKLRERYGSDVGVKVGLKPKPDAELAIKNPKVETPRGPNVDPVTGERLLYGPDAETRDIMESLDTIARSKAVSLLNSVGGIFKGLCASNVVNNFSGYGRTITVDGEWTTAELRKDKHGKPFAWGRWRLHERRGYSLRICWWGFRFWMWAIIEDATGKIKRSGSIRTAVEHKRPSGQDVVGRIAAEVLAADLD